MTQAEPRTAPAWARWFVPALVATVALDQLSKWLLFAFPHTHLWPCIAPAQNTGIAFSWLREWPGIVTLSTVILTPILTWVWWTAFRAQGAIENLAFGLILGGAIGNGVDRLSAYYHWLGLHGVRDFISIDLGFWPFHPFATFNLADSGITVGFVLLVCMSSLKHNAPTAARVQSAHDR